MVDGEAYRIGQIGSFVRIPLGYAQLYGVCTQIGASEGGRPPVGNWDEEFDEPDRDGFRWMTVALFGESIEGVFERGVGQYPTVGDDVHLVTPRDSAVIYGSSAQNKGSISVGHIAGTPSIAANIDLSALVTRHACVVGSTGSGKSNLMAVMLRAIADSSLKSARVLVVDPHGEYASALRPGTFTKLSAEVGKASTLRVPYWALSFDDFARIAIGPTGETQFEYFRDKVRQLKVESALKLKPPVPESDVSADSPIPFSVGRLWIELKDLEDATFTDQAQELKHRTVPVVAGSAKGLMPNQYPPAGLGNATPFLSKARKGISRQLDFMRSRVLDPRFAFMFADGDRFDPDESGATDGDLDELLIAWLGASTPVTILDVSALPPDVLTTVVGSMLSVAYECLFWGMSLPIGGKQQPLLVVLDEAHRFLPSSISTPASDICGRIAREGRKYGIGLMAVTQRPSDIDPTILSQCGSMIALRITNSSDRSAVSSVVPDDLGNLVALLPSLRTGECLVLGEALQVPSRVRVSKAPDRPVGDDPDMPEAWEGNRPGTESYKIALAAWRAQTIASTTASTA